MTEIVLSKEERLISGALFFNSVQLALIEQ